jgi:chromosome segregation ATPase
MIVALQEKDLKLTELRDQVFILDEKCEFLQTSLDNMKIVNADLQGEVETLLKKNSDAEKRMRGFCSELAAFEDKSFEMELVIRQHKEKAEDLEKQFKISHEQQMVLVERLRAIRESLGRLSKYDVQHSPNLTKRNDTVDLSSGLFLVFSETDQVENLLDIVFVQIKQLLEKSHGDVQENERLMSEHELLKTTMENLQYEGDFCKEKVERLEKELKSVLSKVSVEEERGIHSKKHWGDLIYQLSTFVASKDKECQSLYAEYANSVGDSRALITFEDNTDLAVIISQFTANIHIFVTHAEGMLSSISENLEASKNFHRTDNEQLNEQIATLKQNHAQTIAEVSHIREQERLLADSLNEKNLEIGVLRQDVHTLHTSVNEMAMNNAELEKEFKSVTALNVELAQSLSEAEKICNELRSNAKSLQQRVDDSNNGLAHFQTQIEVFQKRASESEMRFESLSYSYKRLKAEKEILENIRLNLESELDQLSTISVKDSMKSSPMFNDFLFEIEKISSALESVMVLIENVNSRESVVLAETFPELKTKVDATSSKLEKIRNWVRSQIKEKQSLEKQLVVLKDELHNKEEQLSVTTNNSHSFQKKVLELEENLNVKSADNIHLKHELDTKTTALQELTREVQQMRNFHDEFVSSKAKLESEARKQESDMKRLNNEILLRDDMIVRLQHELNSEQSKGSETLNELNQRLHQLDSAKANRDTMTVTIQQLEARLTKEQSLRLSVEQQVTQFERESTSVQSLLEEIRKLQLQLDTVRKENTSVVSDKINFEHANTILKRELELTRNKAQSLEQHVVLVQQEKNLYQDEINETRRKIQMAKEGFEFEKTQRIKSEATTAALKLAQDEGRKRLQDIQVFHSQHIQRIPSEEDDNKELKTLLKKMKSDQEDKASLIFRLENEKVQLQMELSKIKEQLASRTTELKEAHVYSTSLRSEGRLVKRKLMDIHFSLKELLHLFKIDMDSALDSFENDHVESFGSDIDGHIKLEEALGIQQLTTVVSLVKQKYMAFRNELKTLRYKREEYSAVVQERQDLHEKVELLEKEKRSIESRYVSEMQLFQSQIKGLNSQDLHSVQLLHQITALESSLRREKEQKEAVLAELTDLTNEVNSALSQKQLQGNYEVLFMFVS